MFHSMRTVSADISQVLPVARVSAASGPWRSIVRIDSGNAPAAAGCRPMRPTSRSPSRSDSTSTGTAERLVAAARPTARGARPGRGWTGATSAAKSSTGSPSTATISVAVRGARRAPPGCPAAILPTRAGTSGYQKSKPRPGSSAPGSVSGAPLAVGTQLDARAPRRRCRAGAARCPDPFISSSRIASTAPSRVPVSRVPTADDLVAGAQPGVRRAWSPAPRRRPPA